MEGEQIDSCFPKRHKCEVKHRKHRPGFEIRSLILFLTTTNIRLHEIEFNLAQDKKKITLTKKHKEIVFYTKKFA